MGSHLHLFCKLRGLMGLRSCIDLLFFIRTDGFMKNVIVVNYIKNTYSLLFKVSHDMVQIINN